MKTIIFTVQTGSPSTLIDFIADELSLSQKKTKRILDQRAVFVNQRRVWISKYRLRPNDRVEVPETIPVHRTVDQLPILYEDAHYLIVNKQPDIVSTGPGSVEQLFQRQRGSSLSAVHRLDRDTSGCFLLAHTEDALQAAIALFRAYKIVKKYHAVVSGLFPNTIQRIDKTIEGKPSSTHIEIIRRNRLASHLCLDIKTGRRHQIRNTSPPRDTRLSAIKYTLKAKSLAPQYAKRPDTCCTPRNWDLYIHSRMRRLKQRPDGLKIISTVWNNLN